jgi:molybdenum cofactor biosynthesis protein A
MAKGRYGNAGNGGVCSRTWKEDMGNARLSDGGGWTDPQGRGLTYLRLAVTDRCNLRCRYCMPEEGIVAGTDPLTFDELTRLCGVLVDGGIRKIRITGGEPLARRGIVDWMQQIASPDLELLLTTNGVLLDQHLPGLIRAGVRRINLSLDTLDPDTWKLITRREGFTEARRSIDTVLEAGLGLKVNVVVQPGVNDHEICDFVELTRDCDFSIRFIEPMPFSGSGTVTLPPVTGSWILEQIAERFEMEEQLRSCGDVDRVFRIDGHRGTVGVIEGNSRSFCSDCCRLRLNARGELRTCLYGAPAANLRQAIRDGETDAGLHSLIAAAVSRRLADGHEAEAARAGVVSMAEVGG